MSWFTCSPLTTANSSFKGHASSAASRRAGRPDPLPPLGIDGREPLKVAPKHLDRQPEDTVSVECKPCEHAVRCAVGSGCLVVPPRIAHDDVVDPLVSQPTQQRIAVVVDNVGACEV